MLEVIEGVIFRTKVWALDLSYVYFKQFDIDSFHLIIL
jgi:hypothetical protein